MSEYSLVLSDELVAVVAVAATTITITATFVVAAVVVVQKYQSLAYVYIVYFRCG